MKSQTGAALLIVLFVVLFLSITGALLLNATTYSKKSIVQTKAGEGEFYLLEGALDLALHNLDETKDYDGGKEQLLDINKKPVSIPLENKNTSINLYINKKGTYFFIKDYFGNKIPNDSIYKNVFDNVKIDNKEIQFNIGTENISETSYNVNISASLVNKPSMKRTIYLTVSTPPKPVERYTGEIVTRNDYIQSPTNLYDKKKIHQNQADILKNKYIGEINFENKKNEYKLIIPLKVLADLTPDTNIQDPITYFNKVIGSTSKPTIVPKNKVVYADSLAWTGKTGTLIVEGVLIINKVNLQSNNVIQINNVGTIIANEFLVGSNSPKFIFSDESNSNTNGGNGTRNYTSDVEWNSYRYSVNNYQTER